MRIKTKSNHSTAWQLALGGLALCAMVPVLVIGQGAQMVDLNIAVADNGCPQQVLDASDSCSALGHPGDAGPGNACAKPGASVLHWSSANQAEFTISFVGSTPLGGALDRTSHNGELVAPVPASSAPGSYKYSVIMIDKDQCPLDPRVIVTD